LPHHTQNPCAESTVLTKFEMFANFSARAGMYGFSIALNGSAAPTPVAQTWRFVDAENSTSSYAFVKVGGFSWTPEEAEGAQVCVLLSKTTSLAEFCGGPTCTLYLYDSVRKCCPQYFVAASP
jgi:hypothetical protein